MSDQSGARRGEYQYRLSLLQLDSEPLLSLFASEEVCCVVKSSIIRSITVRRGSNVCVGATSLIAGSLLFSVYIYLGEYIESNLM